MSSPSIAELATIISHNTAKVHGYLCTQGLTLPSFDVNAPNKSLIDTEKAPEIEAARIAVVDASMMMHDLMLGPKEHLMNFSHDWLLSLQAISEFKMVYSFPIHGEATFAEIGEKCGVEEGDVKRILRHAMTKRIFQETRKGAVIHTAASRLMSESPQMADWIAVGTGELWQAAAMTVQAMKKYPGSQEPNETGFSLANDSQESAFKILMQDAERAKRFGSAMKAYAEGTGFDLQYVADNYPWSRFEDGTIVDVGGSQGFASIKLAETFPTLEFIVQDLPHALAVGHTNVPEGLTHRIKFMPHDFFEEQPVKDADIYFFRWVFHNWSDKYCIRILRSHIPALKKGARIVINDYVLPEPGTLPNHWEEKMRAMDLTMMEMQNSKERELEDWENLFQEADARFEFKGGFQPSGSNLWILEVEWNPAKISDPYMLS